MNRIEFGDCRETLRRWAAQGVKAQMCVTSPPYFGLRRYLPDDHPDKALEIGLEQTPEQFIAGLVDVFRAVRDVLADNGTLWVNIGDSYARNPSKGGSGPGGKNGDYSDSYTAANERRANGNGVGQRAPQLKNRAGADGIKEKDLIGIPWMLAFALRADGWYLRQDIIWQKPNPMPESVRDRCTKAHEYIFLLSKSERYFFDGEAMKEPASDNPVSAARRNRADFCTVGTKAIQGTGFGQSGQGENAKYKGETRNRRSVWTVATKPYNGKKALTDYVGADGKPYTASPDCPIHGHLSRKKTVGTRGYDGQQDQPLTGSVGTDSRHAASPACDEQSTTCRSLQAASACNSEQHTTGSIRGSKTDSLLSECTLGAQNLSCIECSSTSGAHLGCEADCLRQCSSSTATCHSTGASKTGLVPATNPPCTPCAETDNRTQSTSDQHGLFAQDRGISGNSISTGATSAHPSQDTRSCNAGTSSELVSMAYKVEKKCTCNEVIIDHFATFPPALIEPCILAGSRPGDIVLDPFMGSGTTAAVALQHGRQYLGCELNPEYGPLQEQRIADVVGPLFKEAA